MKYMGSKARHAKHILPIILKDRKPDQWYVEPFVGGANVIDKVDGKRIGADSNEYLISMWQAVSNGWLPNKLITEDDYQSLRTSKDASNPETGFAAFALSFGGKFFGGYRRDKAGQKGCMENMENQNRMAINSLKKQQEGLRGVMFMRCSYLDLEIPPNSLIYCDPPYESTTGYKDKFDHDQFWQWCRGKKAEGHTIFVSEYNAPDDFTCVWEKEVNSSLTKNTGAKKATEKLFTL